MGRSATAAREVQGEKDRAQGAAELHAADCGLCDRPSIDRPMTTRCRTGLRHDAAVIGTWRSKVDALSDRLVRP